MISVRVQLAQFYRPFVAVFLEIGTWKVRKTSRSDFQLQAGSSAINYGVSSRRLLVVTYQMGFGRLRLEGPCDRRLESFENKKMLVKALNGVQHGEYPCHTLPSSVEDAISVRDPVSELWVRARRGKDGQAQKSS